MTTAARSMRWGWLVLLLLLLGLASSVVYGWRWLHQPIISQQSINHEIPRGASVSRIAGDLQQAGWLKHPRIWTWWARSQGLSGKIKAGEYSLTTGMTPDDLLHLFTSGEVLLHSITIVEGSTFRELRRALENRQDIHNTLAGRSDAEVMQSLGMNDTHPEGRFFPDTYQFAKHTSDLEILQIAQQRMQRELDTAWQQRASGLLLNNAYEALILASIIEKETAKPSERPMISGVFIERLARGMRLQTDPTVIYGLGADFDGNLRKTDLLRDGPYNTYTRTGLPPTPIALPGAASLLAAVNPERTGALFFVATGKGDGSHYFSRNLQEHNAAVRRYLATQRAN